MTRAEGSQAVGGLEYHWNLVAYLGDLIIRQLDGKSLIDFQVALKVPKEKDVAKSELRTVGTGRSSTQGRGHMEQFHLNILSCKCSIVFGYWGRERP